MDTHATHYRYTVLSRGILGGLFLGIIAAAVNLLFDFIYRKLTGYQFTQYVNINSIIFFTIPTMVAAGILYSFITRNLKQGVFVYMAIVLVLTAVVALFIPLGPNMLPTGESMPSSARGLTVGIEVITGLLAAFALPYIAEHQRIWGEDPD